MAKKTKIINLFDSKNYAKLFKEFMKPYEGGVNRSEIIDLYNIGMNAWNFANMKIILPPGVLDSQAADILNDAPGGDIARNLNDMMERKIKHFKEHDLFIFDVFLRENDDSFPIEVKTMEIDEFMESIGDLEEDPNMFDDELFDMLDEGEYGDLDGKLGRISLHVVAKRPYWKWLVKYREDIKEDDLREDSMFLPEKVYLVKSDFFKRDEWLQENYKKIMQNMFLDFIDESELPKRFTFAMFEKWFDCTFTEFVVDFELLD